MIDGDGFVLACYFLWTIYVQFTVEKENKKERSTRTLIWFLFPFLFSFYAILLANVNPVNKPLYMKMSIIEKKSVIK